MLCIPCSFSGNLVVLESNCLYHSCCFVYDNAFLRVCLRYYQCVLRNSWLSQIHIHAWCGSALSVCALYFQILVHCKVSTMIRFMYTAP